MDRSDLDLLPLTSVVSPAPVTVPVRRSLDPTVSTFARTNYEVARCCEVLVDNDVKSGELRRNCQFE